jgi:hypothetical protein
MPLLFRPVTARDKRGTILKKGITVIAALVAVLAITSGAGAFSAKSYLIGSSSQIKAGAISLSDLSSKARKALKGKPGPKGATGQADAAGPMGPAHTSSRTRSR